MRGLLSTHIIDGPVDASRTTKAQSHSQNWKLKYKNISETKNETSTICIRIKHHVVLRAELWLGEPF